MNRSTVRGPLDDSEWRTHDVILDGRTLPIRVIADAGNGVEGAADDADLLYYYIPGRPLIARDSRGFPKLSLTLLLSRQPTAADENVEPLIMGGYLDLTMTLEVPEGIVSQLESVRKADYRPLFVQAATFSLQLMETSSPQAASAIDPTAHMTFSVALDHDPAITVLQALWGESTPVKARCHLEYRTETTTASVELVSDLCEVIGGCLDGLETERFIRLIVPEEGGGVREVRKLVKPAGNFRAITETVIELGSDVAPGEAETFLSRSFEQAQVVPHTGNEGPFVAVTTSSFYLPASQDLYARYAFWWWYDNTGPRDMQLDVRFVLDGVETGGIFQVIERWQRISVPLSSVTAGHHTISIEVRSVLLSNNPAEVHFSCFEPGSSSPAMLEVYALKANYVRISWVGLTHPSYRLYESLSEPATFVLVPVRYCITRFAPEQGERAYRPAAVLYSNVSADTTADSGAMLLATLCPDIPPWVLTELNQTLPQYLFGQEPTLHLISGIPANTEYPGFVVADGALPLQAHVEKLPESFQVGLQTTINTAPLLTKILELQGIRGMVRFKLQGGPTVESELCLDLRSIVGPLPEGPLGTTRNGDQLRVTNHIERAVVITGEKLSSSGSWMADNRRLGPGETYVIDNASLVSFSIPDADPATLEEVRNYIEDIHVNVKFINLVNFSSHDLRSILVSAQIQGVPSLQHVSLAENGIGTMDFVLPLTRYMANPILQFQVTKTDTQGNETKTDWNEWALSTKGNVLSLDWEMMQ